MLSFTDEFLTRINGKVPDEYLTTISTELNSIIAKYTIEPVTTDVTVYQGYLPEFYPAFFVTKKIEGLSEKTLNLYMNRLNEFFRVMNKPVEEITSLDIRAYLYNLQNTRQITNRTLDNVRSVLGSFFGWASSEGYLEKNIMLAIKPIKYERLPREPLSEYELELLRSACDNSRDKAIVEVLYSSACRVTELVNLNSHDINLDMGEVMLLGKGNKHRKSYLNANSILKLQKYLSEREDDSEALFVGNRAPHERVTKAGIESIIRKFGEKAGIQRRVYPHLIRHTTATIALHRGMDVTEIQKMLGHQNIATTMIYAKTNQDDVKTSHKKYIA